MCGGAIRSSCGRGWGEELGGGQDFRGDLRRGAPWRGFRGLMVVSGFMDYVHDAARRVATAIEGRGLQV